MGSTLSPKAQSRQFSLAQYWAWLKVEPKTKFLVQRLKVEPDFWLKFELF
jgi:hypothetical protein